MAKIQELSSETTLTDEHLLITQSNSDTAETKNMSLALLKTWLDSLTFSDLSSIFTNGDNVNIKIDNENKKITITCTAEKGEKGYSPSASIAETATGATVTITDEIGTTTANLHNGEIKEWASETDYAVNDIVVVETTLYRCHTAHISETDFDSINWTALTGEIGATGYSPTVNVKKTDTGVTITVVNEAETLTTEILNGKDGVTPHIDATTKHWFIGETDTGVLAEGTTTVTTTAVILTGTLLADGWEGDAAPYTQTVTIGGIDETSRPILYPVLSDSVETGISEQKAWGYVTKAVTSTNAITFSCYKTKPTVDINFEAEVR